VTDLAALLDDVAVRGVPNWISTGEKAGVFKLVPAGGGVRVFSALSSSASIVVGGAVAGAGGAGVGLGLVMWAADRTRGGISSTIDLPKPLVVGVPQVFGDLTEAQPTPALIMVTNPKALHAEDFGVHAVGFESVLTVVERTLIDQMKLTTAQASRVVHALRKEMFNEKAGKDRNQWWTSNAWVSPFVDVPINKVKRFQGSLVVAGALTSLSPKGTTNVPLHTRNDIAGTTTRRRKRAWGSRVAGRVGVDLTTILNLGQYVFTPRFDVINVNTSHELHSSQGTMAQSKVAFMHKDKLRRYDAGLNMSLKLISNYGTVTKEAAARAEFGVPEDGASHFEREITREIQAATPLEARVPPRIAPPRWYHVTKWPSGVDRSALVNNAREAVRNKRPMPWTHDGIRNETGLRAQLEHGPIEVVVLDPAVLTQARWAWVNATATGPVLPRVRVVTTVTERISNGARFRYVLNADGEIEGAYRVFTSGGPRPAPEIREFLPNPARTPVTGGPVAAANPGGVPGIEPMPAMPQRPPWWNARAKLRAAKTPRPFMKKGIRGPGDLKALARYRTTEIVLPGTDLPAQWEWVRNHPNVRITTTTDIDRRGALFRYVLRADGVVDGAWRLHPFGSMAEFLVNPAARPGSAVSARRAPVAVPQITGTSPGGETATPPTALPKHTPTSPHGATLPKRPDVPGGTAHSTRRADRRASRRGRHRPGRTTARDGRTRHARWPGHGPGYRLRRRVPRRAGPRYERSSPARRDRWRRGHRLRQHHRQRGQELPATRGRRSSDPVRSPRRVRAFGPHHHRDRTGRDGPVPRVQLGRRRSPAG
jgi:hypothetical protein